MSMAMPRNCEKWNRQVIYRDSAIFLRLFLFFSVVAVVPWYQPVGDSAGLIQQTTQQLRGADSGGSDEKDIRALETGKRIKRELTGGQRHAYQIRLDADQFLGAVVEQDGVDVVVQMSGPDDKHIMGFDSERRPRGQESVSLVAEMAGDYWLTVQPKQKGAAAGGYEIWVEELRAATENDRALHEGRKLYKESFELRGAGKYDEAIPLIERALEIRERILGRGHRDVAAAINVLATLYSLKSERAKAEPLFQLALAIREKALGAEHPDVAASLNNLALFYNNGGNYAKAEPFYQRSVSILENALGPEHPDVATAIYGMAGLYWNKGDYATVEPLCQRALAIWRKSLGPEHPDVARALNGLALLYHDKGDYEKAEPLFQQALVIREQALGSGHPDVADSLHNLANIYHRKGDYTKAEPLYGRALVIREKALGAQHPDVAQSLNNLAYIHSERSDYAKAEPLFHRALAIWERSLGPEHPDIAQSLYGLAELCRRRDGYEKAEPWYQQALAIWEKALGPKHPNIAEPLKNLAVLYAVKGDIAQAITFQSRANAVAEHNLALNLATGSERQKLAYLASLLKQADWAISLHLRFAPNDPKARDLAAILILQRKGRALDAISETLNALRRRFNPEDQALLDQLTDAHSQVARLVLGGPQNMTYEQYRERIKTLEDQAEQYEADISRRSSEFRAQALPITLAVVQAAIPADAVLIEFASYRPFDAKAAKDDKAYGQPRYVAYVLRHEGEIQWKELGEAKVIDKAIAALRRALRNPKRKDVKSLARAVDERVFRPIRPLVGETTRLLISPEGALNLIPFAALVDERGRYLVERYSISYLASGRDLLRLQVGRESQSGPLVVADPDFGGRRQVEATRLLRQKKVTAKEQPKEESPTSVFSQFYFPALPYTAEEGEALRELLSGATLLTKRQASKAALSEVRSPAILHIATHGFFLEDLKMTSTGQALGDDPSRLLKQIERSGLRIESPLLRSGLALAGANEQKKEDNGILTALEVTGLNLWGTKLVVLSACDTGVGEVRNGDGVHGLRRALVLAGAETQVMSLWPVSDRWTRELMVAYYVGLKRREGRGEALRRVQLEMLKDVRRQHPYYWASFIQSGEWANLEVK
jgi:CHAT domain-containing protein/Tfp pilus assembly protein PilF